jgi:hypothetical protein
VAVDTGDPADQGLRRESDEQLRPTDADVVRHAEAGTVCDLTAYPPDQRQVSFPVLYELCVGDRRETDPNGVQLIGALFDTSLSFEHATLRVPLMLASCEGQGGLLMSWAKMPSLVLKACRLAVVDLRGAAIEGDLSMCGARLTGSEGYSLNAELLRVAGNAALDHGFETAGVVRLVNATIDGELSLRDAKLTSADSDSLDADGLRVGRNAVLNQGFETAGAVRLQDARIEGQLAMIGAKLAGADEDGNSLVADRLRAGSAFFTGFETAGAVRLLGATIEDQLVLRDAKLAGANGEGDSVIGDGLRVGGAAFLDDGFESLGVVRLTGAAIEGQLAMRRANFSGGLDLHAASCGELSVAGLASPPQGGLRLRGFRFGAMGGGTNWRQQLEWVRRQGFEDWSPDPYEQLAGWYDRTGDEDAARPVRVAKGDDQLRHLRQTKGWRSLGYRMWRRTLGWLVGYGYRRHRAAWLLLAAILLAGWVFLRADSEGAMTPDEPVVDENGTPVPCGAAYPCFNSWVYGADVVLPIIDFGQDSAWRPVATSDQGQLWVRARWVFIAAGWVLASVFVAAFTSLVQRS